jgi:DNA gyrase subunit A
VFGINMVALVDGQPKLLNLKEILEAFVSHRREVVTRRTVYLLKKARERGHVLEGLAVALANIDTVIELIKSSPNSAEAKEKLLGRSWKSDSVLAMLSDAGPNACRPDNLPEQYGLKDNEYYLSPEQAQAILELRLHRLTGLEHEKLINDYKELLIHIASYLEILNNSVRLMEVIREELQEINENYGDERRTEITSSQHDLSIEDLITEEDRVVTISEGGYAKSQPLADYQAQHRGGTGKAAAKVKDEDFVEHLLVTSSHDTLLCFTSTGKVFWLKVFQIPLASRSSRGKPIVNILPLEEGENITSMLPIREYLEDKFIFMATSNGTVKKTSLINFSRQRSTGLRAIELDEGDSLVKTAITDGTMEVMLYSSSGKVIRFKESDVRAMGRTARGVRGIRLEPEHKMVGLIIPEAESQILAVSENGYGKRTKVADFPTYGRGGKGVIGIQASARNGAIVGAVQVYDGDEIMLISDKGTLVRTRIDEVSSQGRNTQGVRLIKLKESEVLVGLERVEEPEEVADSLLADDDASSDGEDSTSAEVFDTTNSAENNELDNDSSVDPSVHKSVDISDQESQDSENEPDKSPDE